MNTNQIIHCLKNNIHFQGCYASDKLPKKIGTLPAFFIFNTDPSNKPGSHWVSVVIFEDQTGYFFDSYGRYPTNKEFINFMNKHTIKWDYNNKQLQGYFSDVCGQYCLLFVHNLSKNRYSISRFLSQFKNAYSKNDEKVCKMVEKSFKKFCYIRGTQSCDYMYKMYK